MMGTAEKLQGLANAQLFEKGAYLQAPGLYGLEISNVLWKNTQRSGDGFIVEFKVLTSNNSGNPVGTKATWFQKMTDKNVAFGALKEFTYAVLGLDYSRDKERCVKEIDPVIEALLTEAIEKGAFNGKKVQAQTFMKKTGKNLDFTVHKWSPLAA